MSDDPKIPPPPPPPPEPPRHPVDPRPPWRPRVLLTALPLVILLLACRGETGYRDPVVRGVVSHRSEVFVAGGDKPSEYRLTIRTDDGPQVVVVSAGGFAVCPVDSAYPQCLNKIGQNGAYR